MVGNDLPYRTNTVTLDPDVKDVCGVPVARVTYTLHKHEYAAQMFYFTKLGALVKAAGADLITILPPGGDTPPDSVHVMGGMQLGTDQATGVCDPYGRVHGTDNVYVADGSVFVTSGAQNPTLTLMAAALRSMRHLAGRRRIHPDPEVSGRDAGAYRPGRGRWNPDPDDFGEGRDEENHLDDVGVP
jgi:choline dehydrogenase-like flavoprotein